MNKTKALIFDLDGTAVDSPAKELPSARLKLAIKKLAKEYYICIATGRPFAMSEHIINFLEIKDPCLLSGASQIFDPIKSKVIWQGNIDPLDIKKAHDILKNYSVNIVINNFSNEDYSNNGYELDRLLTTDEIFNFGIVSLKRDKAEEILLSLGKLDGLVATLGVSHKPGLVDIHTTSKGVSKEHTVSSLLDELNISKDNTWGFGDGHNDIHLFNAVGHKVAMGNAVPELKAVADEVIGDVKNDGLAEYFEQLSKGQA